MNFKPLKKNLIVLKVSSTKTTSSGIILKSSLEPDKAKVIGIGPDVENISIGDLALVDWNKAQKIDEYMFVIPEEAFVAIYE